MNVSRLFAVTYFITHSKRHFSSGLQNGELLPFFETVDVGINEYILEAQKPTYDWP
jgi:hypothetical protein